MQSYNWDEAVEWIGVLVADMGGQVLHVAGDVDRYRWMIDEYINAYRFIVFHLRRERYLQSRPYLRQQVYPQGCPIQISERGPFVIVRCPNFFYAVIVLEHIIYINKWRILPTV